LAVPVPEPVKVNAPLPVAGNLAEPAALAVNVADALAVAGRNAVPAALAVNEPVPLPLAGTKAVPLAEAENERTAAAVAAIGPKRYRPERARGTGKERPKRLTRSSRASRLVQRTTERAN
jgi:hypothetical protein